MADLVRQDEPSDIEVKSLPSVISEPSDERESRPIKKMTRWTTENAVAALKGQLSNQFNH